ncbi:MAG: hypothetical protein U5R31_02065 [Acidimicrobiia bacterium]|nr:hypothetical protein [Acidimicrobiia bacterium]
MASRLLDDPRDPVVAVADHPAVPGRVRKPGGENRARRVAVDVLGDQAGDRRGPQERSVAREHQDVAVVDVTTRLLGERREADADRVAGAALDVLLDELEEQVGAVLLQLLGHPFGAMAHDHDRAVDDALAERVEHVEKHRPPAEQVERLGPLGAHPGALAGGEDHPRERSTGHGPSF